MPILREVRNPALESRVRVFLVRLFTKRRTKEMANGLPKAPAPELSAGTYVAGRRGRRPLQRQSKLHIPRAFLIDN